MSRPAAEVRGTRVSLGATRDSIRIRGVFARAAATLPRPSVEVERAWILGRFGLVAAALAGSAIFMRGTSGEFFIYGAGLFALSYNLLLHALLRRNRLELVYRAGLVLDNLTLLAAWWGVSSSLAGEFQTNDLYLILFPVLIVGVVRLGWLFGTAFATLWIGWLASMDLVYSPHSGYDVRQLPVRLMFLGVTAVLASRLVARLQSERDRAESLREETAAFAELDRVAASTLGAAQLFNRLAGAVARLVALDRIELIRVDPKDSTYSELYVASQGTGRWERGRRRHLAGSIVERALRLPGGIIESREIAPPPPAAEGGSNQEERQFDSALAVSIPSQDAASMVLLLSSQRPVPYTENDLEIANRIANSIAPTIQNAMLLEELEARIADRTAELEEANQAKGRLLSVVSHELRTPLASMIGFAELLSMNRTGNLTKDQIESLRVIGRNGQNLNLLINDLLDMSRIESGSLRLTKSEFDVAPLIRDIEQSFSVILAPKRQSLLVKAPTRPIKILADRDRIYQVVSNLVSNASKYSPEGSSIGLRVRGNGDRVRVEVEDRGIGISQEDQLKLFEPFFRANNEATQAVHGTGLGLVISRSIVQMHGGQLTYVSAPGKGSTFTVELPSAGATE